MGIFLVASEHDKLDDVPPDKGDQTTGNRPGDPQLKVPCPTCSQWFKNPSSLKRHQKRQHNTDSELKSSDVESTANTKLSDSKEVKQEPSSQNIPLDGSPVNKHLSEPSSSSKSASSKLESEILVKRESSDIKEEKKDQKESQTRSTIDECKYCL